MPSEHQSADTSQRLRCPALEESIGEDPARWLDRDLMTRTTRRQEPDTSDSLTAMRLVVDKSVSSPWETVRSVIDGIDSLERIRAWRAVERKLANDEHNDGARNPLEEPRGAVMNRLDQREQWLKIHGERPDRLPFGPRESCDCCEADGFMTAAEIRERKAEEWSRRSDGYTATGADTSETASQTEEVGLEAFADGGESRE